MTDEQDKTDPNEATETADLYERKGKPDPEAWETAPAVTGRPADKPGPNTTLADRAKARINEPKAKPDSKVVDDDAAENKAVTKAPARKSKAKG